MNLTVYEELPNEILLKLRFANVFFQKEYVNYIRAEHEELYFIFDKDWIMPVRHRKKFVFNLCVLVSEPYHYNNITMNNLGDFLDNAIHMINEKLGAQWCNTTAAGLFEDTTTTKCKRIPFGSHVIDLTKDQEYLWSKVHSKHRNVIRRAEKAGIAIKAGGIELLQDYVLLENETSDRTGRSASGYSYYKKQIESMGDSIRVYIAYKDKVPQAGGVFYFNKAMCYYMYGTTGKNSFNGAANLLLWHVMLDMKDIGVAQFSFVGCRINEDEDSKYHGIQRFKERFGGELKKGYMFRYEEKPLMYKLFCVAMQIRQRKTTIYKDPVDEEIHKWPNEQI